MLRLGQGEPKAYDAIGASGKINKHFFCGSCGSSLYCELEVMPDNTVIKYVENRLSIVSPLIIMFRAGSLDQPDVGEMQVEFYVKDRLSYQKPQENASQVPAFG